MKNGFKKAFCLLAMPLLLSTSLLNVRKDNNYLNNFRTTLVNRAGSLSPSISIQGSKYLVDNQQYEYSNLSSTIVNINSNSTIEISLESTNDIFKDNSYPIDVDFYSYTENPSKEGDYIQGEKITTNPPVSISIENTSVTVRKYTFTVTRKSTFGIIFSSQGNTTYDTFETQPFIFVGSRIQTGITISSANDTSTTSGQIDGGRFDIVYTGNDGSLQTIQFSAIKDADAKISSGIEEFTLGKDIIGDKDGISITSDGIVSISSSNIQATLIYTKYGDTDYDDLVYHITLNVSTKIETPKAIFESDGQLNYNNTLYNLVPYARYKIYYTTTDNRKGIDDITALDGENVLSDDPDIDYLYSTATYKGYYVVDSNHSTSMANATITSIVRIGLANETGRLIDSDAQSTSFTVLPRKALPVMYDKENNKNGIRYDDANGELHGLRTGVEYIVNYRKKDEGIKLYSYIVNSKISSDLTYSFDLAQYLPGGAGATLVSIAVHGESGTRIEDCIANSFTEDLNGVVYEHEIIINNKDNPIQPDRAEFIREISGLEPNTPYLLYTNSIKNKEYLTITSDNDGKITIDNNNLLGQSDFENYGVRIIGIKKAGKRTTDTITTNSSLLIVGYTFINIDEYKKSIIDDGKEKVEEIGKASLKQTGILSLNDKQIRAMDRCKADIQNIDTKNLTTKEIREQIDKYTEDLRNSINSYIGFWGYLNSIEGWIYIALDILFLIILLIVIAIYRSNKKRYQKYSVTVLQRFVSVAPFSLLFVLFDITSVGGRFFAPLIMIIEIIFIGIFIGLAMSYSRKASDLKRWKKYHDQKGELITDNLPKSDLKKMQKYEKKAAKKIEKKDKKADKKAGKKVAKV